MDISGAGVLVTAAILLGIIHSFDIDHLITVATFSTAKSGKKNSIRYCTHWAIGHGATLLILAIAMYFLGVKIPAGINIAAEALVGVVLIGMGVWILKSIHRYFLVDKNTNDSSLLSIKRKPIVIGILHGFAGSAPILLIFLIDVRTPLIGLGLILIFITGVFLSMILVGYLFGLLFERITNVGQQSIQIFRGTLASVSIMIGSTMVYGYF